MSDAYVSLGRIGDFLLAEEQEATFVVKQGAEYAVDVEGDFTWEVVDPNKTANTKGVVGNAGSAKEIMAQAKEATRQQRGKDRRTRRRRRKARRDPKAVLRPLLLGPEQQTLALSLLRFKRKNRTIEAVYFGGFESQDSPGFIRCDFWEDWLREIISPECPYRRDEEDKGRGEFVVSTK
jgi:hypothetical protein